MRNETLMNSRRVRLFPATYKYACYRISRHSAADILSSLLFSSFFFYSTSRRPVIESVSVVAVSAARVHPDRIVSRRRRRGGIRQQRQSASEQRGSQRNRSEQGPKRGHSRGTEGNGHPEIQVHLYATVADLFHPPPNFFTLYFLDLPGVGRFAACPA